MKKTALILAFVCMFIFAGCSQGEYMPEVKNRANVFEIYDCGSKKLVKELNVNSDADQLLILDSIINNADNSKDYTEELSEVEPEYVLVNCGETDETTIYVKIRFPTNFNY